MTPTPNAPAVALARIGTIVGEGNQSDDAFDVHFNPVSLQIQVSNEQKDTGNQKRKQSVAKTSTKLSMELIFDTTATGEDVTLTTRKIQAFVAPQPPPGKKPAGDAAPPVVLFEWGTLSFKGVAESYKETIDFFSANGVPLRSSISLTLSRQDAVFDKAPDNAPQNAGGVDADLFDAPASSAADLSNNAEAPGAARAVAAFNGQESLRFGASAGASLTVGASVDLKPAVAFATGGAGIGIGGGLGIGIGGGVGIGASGGLSLGVSASAGLSGMARLSATEGAFAGLRVTTGGAATVSLDPSRLVPKITGTTLATDAGATFQVGGKASVSGAGGLRADVGATGKLTFDAS